MLGPEDDCVSEPLMLSQKMAGLYEVSGLLGQHALSQFRNWDFLLLEGQLAG